MATKWKYATIPAAQRLSMLLEGNDELYSEEIARTEDAIRNRLEAGLDVSEQMKWADSVSYNHNLAKAKNMGIASTNVAKEGYADRLFGDITASRGSTVSSVSSPTSLNNKKYYENYTELDRDGLARSVADSYIGGINRRLGSLTDSYNKFVKDITVDYSKKKSDAVKAYRENEKYYEEALLNGGYSENGGRSLTQKLKSREQLIDLLAELEAQKTSAISNAEKSLREQVYEIGASAMSGLADEYYRYNQLLSEENQREYQKQRDSAADDKWWNEFLFEKEKTASDNAFRTDELEHEKTKEANDRYIAEEQLRLDGEKQFSDIYLSEKEIEQKREQYLADYEKWLREFESDSALDRDKLALDREKFEYQKQKDAAKSSSTESESENESRDSLPKYANNEETPIFGEKYAEYMEMAAAVASDVVYNERTGKYERKYSDRELLSWILSFDLTETEKRRICDEFGLEYAE